MTMRMFLILVLGLVISGCKTTAIYDFDDSVNFNQLRTYAWVVESKSYASNNSFYLSDISHKRMITAIDSALTYKGLIKVAPEKADVLVNYHASINKKIERDLYPTHSAYWAFGYPYHHSRLGHYPYGYSRFGWQVDMQQIREYSEGSLVIDFIDNKQTLIWRGSKGSRLSQKLSPSERTAQINETVSTILENFPPKS